MWYDLAQSVFDDRHIYLEALRKELPDVVDTLVALPDEKEVELFGKNHMHLPFARTDGTVILLRVHVQPVTDTDKYDFENAVRSEIATMKALRSACLPVPAVYTRVMSVNGHLCFALEKMDGLAPGEHVLEASYPSRALLSSEQIETLVKDLAAFYVKLSLLQYPYSGMLQADGDIGPILHDPTLKVPYDHAPQRYRTYRERVQAELEARLSHAPTVMHALVYVECSAMLAHAAFDDLEPDTHYILHTDDKAAQYLLDEAGHLRAVLDWEWAITTSKGDAFSGPVGLSNRSHMASGRNDLCAEEQQSVIELEKLGRPDLAQCVRDGKKYQRLSDALYFIPHPGNLRLLVNIQALRMAVTGEPFDAAESWSKWTKRKVGEYEGDPRLERFQGHSYKDVYAW